MAGNYGAHGPMNDIRYIGAYVQNFAYANTLSNFDRMGYTNTDVAQSFGAHIIMTLAKTMSK